MGRAKRTIEQEWFDVFADADYADQDAMLRVLAELHRQKRRGKLPQAEVAPPTRAPLATDLEPI